MGVHVEENTKTTLVNYVLTHHTGNYAWKVSTESGEVLFSVVK